MSQEQNQTFEQLAHALEQFQHSYTAGRQALQAIVDNRDQPVGVDNSDGEPVKLEPGTAVHTGFLAGLRVALTNLPPFPIDMNPADEEK